jgi:L-lactate dehydrogenase complex protein LldG
MNARENILLKIRTALREKVDRPFPELGNERHQFFAPESYDLAILFAQHFNEVQGHFYFCSQPGELLEQVLQLGEKKGITRWYDGGTGLSKSWKDLNWHDQLADCHASITHCECLVARTGSMLLSSTASGGRAASVYAPIHVCVAYTHQLVYDISDAIEAMLAKYGKHLPSLLSLATGPSRTADIEKTLVTGVHGPKEVYCFLMEHS